MSENRFSQLHNKIPLREASGAPKLKHFIKKDNSMIFIGNYMECYIPEAYFNSGFASYNGDRIESFGVFNYRVYDRADMTNVKVQLHCSMLPAIVSMRPNDVETKELELVEGMGVTAYVILKFYRDAEFIDNRYIVKSVDNMEIFVKLLNAGKLPNTIQYDDLVVLMNKCATMNGVNLEVSSALLEAYIAEICRDSSNKSKPYRMKAGKGQHDPYGYKPASLREISRLSSTFAAVSFEDIDTMLVSSVVRSRNKGRESYSPLEKIMKF